MWKLKDWEAEIFSTIELWMHFKRLNEKWRYYFIDVISVLNGNMKDAPATEFGKENILAMEKLKYVVLDKHLSSFPWENSNWS